MSARTTHLLFPIRIYSINQAGEGISAKEVHDDVHGSQHPSRGRHGNLS
jgi:hypothetical protein